MAKGLRRAEKDAEEADSSDPDDSYDDSSGSDHECWLGQNAMLMGGALAFMILVCFGAIIWARARGLLRAKDHVETTDTWVVLQDTDWPHNCQHPYHHGESAVDCANQCKALWDCVAVSWNGPRSQIKDFGCNFKCSTKSLTRLEGEESVIVQPSLDLCGTQPACEPREPCPADMPEDWLKQCTEGNLFYSPRLTGCELPEIGNGYLATVVLSDTIFVSGLFNGDAKALHGQGSHRARVPTYNVGVTGIDGQEVEGFRALDVQEATFMRRSILPTHVKVDERWYAPLHEPTLLVHEITLTNLMRTAQNISLTHSFSAASQDLLMKPERIANGNFYVASGANRVPEVDNKTVVTIAANKFPRSIELAPWQPPNGTVGINPANLPLGSPGLHSQTLYALTVVVTSLNSTVPTREATKILKHYTDHEFERAKTLQKEHAAAWRERAERGRLEVQGDLNLARALNASLYFIRSSIRDDWPFGMSPGGLASNGFGGHTFSDQERWIFPALLMLEPESARSILQYRSDRMAAARSNAAFCGMDDHAYCPENYTSRVAKEALMFPWESAFRGVEVQFGEKGIGIWGKYHLQTSGDIAFAARQYWYAARDRKWLREVGFPIVNGSASFYAARMEERPDSDGKYDINTVMGPDESAYPVNNSAYTNAVAKITLEFAAEAAGELGYTDPLYADFARKAKGLWIPFSDTVPGRPDLKGGYHPEYEGFGENSNETWKVKQADTILLSFPLGIEMDRKALVNDLSFYGDITGPPADAVTWSMFAIGWITAKNYTKSPMLFKKGYADMLQPFGVWQQSAEFGIVNYITGAGGFLQSLLFGVAGIRLGRDGLIFDPAPLKATGSSATGFVVHSLHFLGSRLRFQITPSTQNFQLLSTEANAKQLAVVVGGVPQLLKLGRWVKLKRRKTVELKAWPPENDA